MMRKNTKSFMIAMTLAILLSMFASLALNTVEPGNYSQPPDFYAVSREVSLNEMVEVANKYNISLSLPSEFPSNLELTAIYLMKSPFLAIVVYSAEGNKDYKTAELGIQIKPVPPDSTPTYLQLESQVENSEFEYALEINGWPVKVNEKADSGGDSEFRDKYGENTLLVRVWIEGNEYTICAPTLKTDDAVQLVACMSLIT